MSGPGDDDTFDDDGFAGDGFDDDGAGGPAGPLRPGEVLKLVLPVFAASAVVAAVGIVLMLTGHTTLGLVIVGVAAVGGLFVRAVLVFRAQERRRTPGN